MAAMISVERALKLPGCCTSMRPHCCRRVTARVNLWIRSKDATGCMFKARQRDVARALRVPPRTNPSNGDYPSLFCSLECFRIDGANGHHRPSSEEHVWGWGGGGRRCGEVRWRPSSSPPPRPGIMRAQREWSSGNFSLDGFDFFSVSAGFCVARAELSVRCWGLRWLGRTDFCFKYSSEMQGYTRVERLQQAACKSLSVKMLERWN